MTRVYAFCIVTKMEIIMTALFLAMILMSGEVTYEPLPQMYVRHELPDETDGSFKTYMHYETITDRSSSQWQLQQKAITDEHGFRKHSGRYMIALGTYYAPRAGMLFEIELSSGLTLDCITGDVKDDLHTDSTSRYIPHNGNIVEFIVDSSKLSKQTKRMGNVSFSGLEGEIVAIREIRKPPF